jgi:hypothetical protein
MDLWSVRKRYRRAAQHLRNLRTYAVLRAAELQLLGTIALHDRLEAELALVRFRDKLARGRSSRGVALFTAAFGEALGRVGQGVALPEITAALRRWPGGDALLPAFTLLAEEFEQLAVREQAVRARIAALAPLAERQLGHLLRLARAGPLLAHMTGASELP